MTGFGRGEDENLSIEIKSLNHKYLELNIHLPPKISFLENLIIEKLKSFLHRGKITISINYKAEKEEKIPIDINMAKAYLNTWNQLGRSLNLENDIKLSDLVRVKEIYTHNDSRLEEIEHYWPLLNKVIEKALEDLEKSKIREGEKILKDLKKTLKNMNKITKNIEKEAEKVPEIQKERICQRLKELPFELEAYEDRIALEVAFYINKCDINEELVRIKGHLKEINDLFKKKEVIGKNLEFICQEINREVNTIGAKANLFEISKKVISFKNELEKFKEQVRNIE
jgi:uncharacterized protein (TIGR00255 family)